MSEKKTPKKKKTGNRSTTRNVFQDGPYVNAAFICERLLQEQDGVKSAIRIVDRFNRSIHVTSGEPPEKMPPLSVDLWLLLKLKSGSCKGKKDIRITFLAPGGGVLGSHSGSVVFGGDNRGVDVQVRLQMDLGEEGVYWFDVLLDEWLLTRVPLEIRYLKSSQGPVQTEASVN